MTIEVSFLISGISVAAAIYFGISNLRRNQKADIKAEATETKAKATEMTTVIVKLENIGTGITEIKAELSNVKNDIKEDRERLIRVDESLKSAWKAINELKTQFKRNGDDNAG